MTRRAAQKQRCVFLFFMGGIILNSDRRHKVLGMDPFGFFWVDPELFPDLI